MQIGTGKLFTKLSPYKQFQCYIRYKASLPAVFLCIFSKSIFIVCVISVYPSLNETYKATKWVFPGLLFVFYMWIYSQLKLIQVQKGDMLLLKWVQQSP